MARDGTEQQVPHRTRRARNAEETRALLVAVARRRFAAEGFAAATVDQILDDAGVAKGALYHHFSGKDDLLRAVVVEVQAELAARVDAARRGVEDAGARGAWDRVDAGCRALLDACSDPDVQRILVLDHPAVLGDEGSPLAGVVELLRDDIAAAATADGNPCRAPLTPLAQMLCGAIQEGALVVARAARPEHARREVGETTALLLRAIRSELLAC
jgi:AcrR family transcriptional regulator